MGLHRVDTELASTERQRGDGRGERGAELGAELRAAQQGDDRAFDRMIRPQLGRLLALARRLSPSEHRAEELLQEALIRAHRSLAGYRAEGSFRAWVATILYRLASEPQRLGPRPMPGQQELGTERWQILPDSLAFDPAERASTKDVLRRVEAAMERLPLRQRTALHLRSVEGFSYAEIARVLETSEGTVRNAVMHARQKLRSRLGDLL